MDRTGTASEILGRENVFVSSTMLGASTHDAYAAAERWLQERSESQRHTINDAVSVVIVICYSLFLPQVAEINIPLLQDVKDEHLLYG